MWQLENQPQSLFIFHHLQGPLSASLCRHANHAREEVMINAEIGITGLKYIQQAKEYL